MTKAAERLSVTQSAISQQIKLLENKLNIKLFNRVGPKKNLTPDGKLFFDLIAPIIQQVDNLKITFEDMKGNQKGLLTIAVSTVVIMNHLPIIIKKFTKEFPSVRLIILERRWNEIIALAQSGEIDFGITPATSIPDNLHFIPLNPIDRVLITSLDNPLSKKKQVTLLDIAQYPLITYEKGLIPRMEMDKVFDQVKLDVEVVIEATNAETIKRYVELGIGIAIIPKIALPTSYSKMFAAIPVSDYFGKSQYGIVIRQEKHITSWARNFLNLLDPNWEENLKDQTENNDRG